MLIMNISFDMLFQNINLQNPEAPRRDEESFQEEEGSSEEFQEGVSSQPFYFIYRSHKLQELQTKIILPCYISTIYLHTCLLKSWFFCG